MEPVELVVYSDFLCPWCYDAAVRLERLEDEFRGGLWLQWRAYLLRPEPRPPDLERFRAYTRSWLRVAEDEPGCRIRTWQGDTAPPTHSVPAQVLARAGRAHGDAAARRLRDRLFLAYFHESRDISDADTLHALWSEAGLPADAWPDLEDASAIRAVMAEHEEALHLGATGVPAVRLADQDFVLVGAQPEETYRRWVRRVRAARCHPQAGA